MARPRTVTARSPTPSKAKLVAIGKPEVAKVVPILRQFDLTKTEWSEEEIRGLCEAGMQLWLIWADNVCFGALTTRIESRTRRDWKQIKIMVCDFLVGRQMHRWVHLLSDLEQWAKDEGCTHFRIQGRNGWKRIFRDYKQTGVILDKAL